MILQTLYLRCSLKHSFCLLNAFHKSQFFQCLTARAKKKGDILRDLTSNHNALITVKNYIAKTKMERKKRKVWRQKREGYHCGSLSCP